HFSIFEIGEGQCSSFNAGPTVPSQAGGDTTNFDEIDRCVAWLGPNQPGINQEIDAPKYDPSVCPEGSTDPEICDPGGEAASTKLSRKGQGAASVRGADGKAGKASGAQGSGGGAGAGAGSGGSNGSAGGGGDSTLGDVLGIDPAPQGAESGGRSGASNDLLGFLLDD
ncbi:MAG: hypothetical protein ACR2K6_03940, partial [Solirubrobacterales bacterium]